VVITSREHEKFYGKYRKELVRVLGNFSESSTLGTEFNPKKIKASKSKKPQPEDRDMDGDYGDHNELEEYNEDDGE